MEQTDSFGYWLKRRRKALDLTQAELADRAGCALVTIKKIEADERRPSQQMAHSLARALGLPPEEQEAFIRTARGLQAVHRLEVVATPQLVAPIPAATPADISHPEHLIALVGRTHELELAHKLWQDARAGRLGVLLVQGEAGIGKTRLVEELLAGVRARENGSPPVVLRGGCYELAASAPYLPLVEALRGWLAAQPVRAWTELLGPSAAELARLIPDLAAQTGASAEPQAGSMQEQRVRLYEAVSRALQRLAHGGGLVLFIDDLHWIDQGTLGMLAYLLRQLQHAPVLFVATYREDEFEAQPELVAARLNWRRAFHTHELPLQRLSLVDTGDLLARLFEQEEISREFAEAIYTETEGNPFFVVEMAYALVDHGLVYRVDGDWERKSIEELALPASIKDTIERRLQRLDPQSVGLLRTAALLGKQFRFEELAAVLQQPEVELLDALDQALQARLVVGVDDETFQFSHDKIREVLYREQNPVRRRLLHRQCAERLEALYGSDVTDQAGRLAYHFHHAGEHARALPYACQAAGRAEALFAPDEALAYLDQALENARALDLRAEQADIHEAIGDLYAQNSPFDRAIQHYQHTAALVDDPDRQLALQVKLGQVYSDIGDPRGQLLLETALKVIDPEKQPLVWLQAITALGRFLHYQARYSRALACYEQALPRLEASGDQVLIAKVYGYIAGCYQHLTEMHTSNEWAYKTIDFGREHQHPYAEAVGYEFLSENLFMQGYWEQAVETALINQGIGKQIGSVDRVAWSLLVLGISYHQLGAFAQAEQAFQECAGIAESIQGRRLAALNGIYQVQLLVDQGQDDAALALGRQYVAAGDELGETQLSFLSRLSLAYLCYQQGDPHTALAWIEQAYPLLQGTEIRSTGLLYDPLAAAVYLALGEAAQAQSIAAAGVVHAQAADAPFPQAGNQLVLAQLAARRGERAQAEAQFAAAIELLENTGSRLMLGRVYRARGEYYLAEGEREQGQADLSQAREIFAAIGAPRDLAGLKD
jgi:transcriptional regulator with XRE-family HTH domain/tetratricopeptide (TPR) repeat protein